MKIWNCSPALADFFAKSKLSSSASLKAFSSAATNFPCELVFNCYVVLLQRRLLFETLSLVSWYFGLTVWLSRLCGLSWLYLWNWPYNLLNAVCLGMSISNKICCLRSDTFFRIAWLNWKKTSNRLTITLRFLAISCCSQVRLSFGGSNLSEFVFINYLNKIADLHLTSFQQRAS